MFELAEYLFYKPYTLLDRAGNGADGFARYRIGL